MRQDFYDKLEELQPISEEEEDMLDLVTHSSLAVDHHLQLPSTIFAAA